MMKNNKDSVELERVHYEVVWNECRDLYIKKNKDYGGAFGKSINKFGMVAALIRMDDKMTRLVELYSSGKDPEVTDESIRDTLVDLANYSMMMVAQMDMIGKTDGVNDNWGNQDAPLGGPYPK